MPLISLVLPFLRSKKMQSMFFNVLQNELAVLFAVLSGKLAGFSLEKGENS
jgi:hypothetical protein